MPSLSLSQIGHSLDVFLLRLFTLSAASRLEVEELADGKFPEGLISLSDVH